MKSFAQAPERRTVVVPKNDRFAAFGSALLLRPDETLLCSYTRVEFERDTVQKVLITSADRGRTWSEPRLVEQVRGPASRSSRAESLTRLRDGRIALISNVESGKEHPDGFKIRFSSDDGVTWTDPAHVGRGTVPWCNRIVETDEDDLLITCRAPHDFDPVAEGALSTKVVMQYRSQDHGHTWEGPEIIAQATNLKLTEPSVIRLRDGRLMCAVRETSYVDFPSYRIFSGDGGRTWSPIQEMPLCGHELYLGQLHSGRVMVAYRNVGGYSGTLAWVGDPDEQAGFQVPATLRCQHPPELVDGRLKIRTDGQGETALYHLHSPEGPQSTIRLRVELRCLFNQKNACAVHVAQAGWVNFYPEGVELPDCGLSARLDATRFHCYEIVRDESELRLAVDGEQILATRQLHRVRVQETFYGDVFYDNVTTFGTRSPFFGDLEAEAAGFAEWRSVEMHIANPNHPSHEYRWDARSGLAPNHYEEDRMIEIENNYGGNLYFVGQVAWVQFADGEIFMVSGRQYARADGRRSSWLRGCILYEQDFGSA